MEINIYKDDELSIKRFRHIQKKLVYKLRNIDEPTAKIPANK